MFAASGERMSGHVGLEPALQRFSTAVAGLYSKCEEATPDQFPRYILEAVRVVIAHDAALLARLERTPSLRPALLVDEAYVQGREPSLVQEYAELVQDDPVANSVLEEAWGPLVIACSNQYAGQEHRQLRNFYRRHRVRHVLAFGKQPAHGRSTLFICLYRSGDHPFTAEDANRLEQLWPHVLHAHWFNMTSALREVDPFAHTRAAALLTQQGRVMVTNAAMRDLLGTEWPGAHLGKIPNAAFKSLAESGQYRGRRIELFGYARQSYFSCTGRRAPRDDSLSPSERKVARAYAAGQTYTEIATQFQVSRHTVRNQLAQIYLKLGVHSKAELVRKLSSRSAGKG